MFLLISVLRTLTIELDYFLVGEIDNFLLNTKYTLTMPKVIVKITVNIEVVVNNA